MRIIQFLVLRIVYLLLVIGCRESEPLPASKGIIQMQLEQGVTILEILAEHPKDSLYGKTYQGGVIFYVDENTGTGLVAAATDQSDGAPWGCQGILTSAVGSEIGTGAQNTDDIRAECLTPEIAADLCADLILDGFSDWFLPSQEELEMISINLPTPDFGNSTNRNYWSSTESSATTAIFYSYESQQFNSLGKSLFFRVRAIRAF